MRIICRKLWTSSRDAQHTPDWLAQGAERARTYLLVAFPTSITLPSLDIIINPFLEYFPKLISIFPTSKLWIGSFFKASKVGVTETGTPKSFITSIPFLCPDVTYSLTPPSTVLFVYPLYLGCAGLLISSTNCPLAVWVVALLSIASFPPILAFISSSPWYIPMYKKMLM